MKLSNMQTADVHDASDQDGAMLRPDTSCFLDGTFTAEYGRGLASTGAAEAYGLLKPGVYAC